MSQLPCSSKPSVSVLLSRGLKMVSRKLSPTFRNTASGRLVSISVVASSSSDPDLISKCLFSALSLFVSKSLRRRRSATSPSHSSTSKETLAVSYRWLKTTDLEIFSGGSRKDGDCIIFSQCDLQALTSASFRRSHMCFVRSADVIPPLFSKTKVSVEDPCGVRLASRRLDLNSQRRLKSRCIHMLLAAPGLTSDDLCYASAFHPKGTSPAKPSVVFGSIISPKWAWPNTNVEETSLCDKVSRLSTMILNAIQIDMTLVCPGYLKISDGFISVYTMRLLINLSFMENFSVGSPLLLPVASFSFFEESVLQLCLLFVKGDDFSGFIPSVWFSLLTGLSSCVAVCTGPEGAIKFSSDYLVGEGWLLTSQQKVTKSLLSDFIVKAFSTHSSHELNLLSTSLGDLSCLISYAIVVHVYSLRGCLIPSLYCSPSS